MKRIPSSVGILISFPVFKVAKILMLEMLDKIECLSLLQVQRGAKWFAKVSFPGKFHDKTVKEEQKGISPFLERTI